MVNFFLTLFLMLAVLVCKADRDFASYLLLCDVKHQLQYTEYNDSGKVEVQRIASYKMGEEPAATFLPGYTRGSGLDTIVSVDPVTLNTVVSVIKDTIWHRARFGLPGYFNYISKLKKPWSVDTVWQFNPVTLHDTVLTVPHNDAKLRRDYGDVAYERLVSSLQAGLEIAHNGIIEPLESVWLYYESPTDAGKLVLKYPDPDKEALAKLSCLKQGGFVIIIGTAFVNHFGVNGTYLNDFRPWVYVSVNAPQLRPPPWE